MFLPSADRRNTALRFIDCFGKLPMDVKESVNHKKNSHSEHSFQSELFVSFDK